MASQDHQVQEIKETAPLNLTSLLPQKFTPQTQVVKTDKFKKEKQTRTVSQRNNPQSKGKEDSPERVLKETEISKLSDTEFKIMVIKKLSKLNENYQKVQGSYKELTENYISMEKDVEIINKNQEEMKNTISELKNTVEGIKSRLDEAEDRISDCLLYTSDAADDTSEV